MARSSRACSTASSLGQEGQDERDITLTRPIRVTEKGQQAADSNADRIVVPSGEILHITVIHIPEATAADIAESRLRSYGQLGDSDRPYPLLSRPPRY